MAELLAVEEAKKRLLAHFGPVDTTQVPLNNACLGRILATDINSPIDLPPFPNSSMDGFALRSADVRGSSAENPATLEVIGDIPAGSVPSFTIMHGQCARIMTGAPLPEGADAVIPVEETNAANLSSDSPLPSNIQVKRAVTAGEFVRLPGQDVHVGQLVLEKGRRLRPQDIGILAMLGISRVQLFRQPRIALLSTGDELVSSEEELLPGKIRESNSYSLGALIQYYGGQVESLGTTRDEFALIQSRLDEAVHRGVDLIVSSAGVSVGAHDYVRAVVEKNGSLEFWRVNMRPGKPLIFGYYRNLPILGLPGNPVSSFVTFEVFVRPVLLKMSGATSLQRWTIPVILEEAIESDGRESYLRAILTQREGRITAKLTGHQGSGNLFSLVQANALLIIPSGVKSLPAGSEVQAWPLEY